MTHDRLVQLANLYRESLLSDVVPFWQAHSPDLEYGGFFTFLDRTGRRYGDDKPIWLQGRAAWMFATLYRLVEPRPEWLALARHGCEFLDRCAVDATGKLFFCVTREGRPLRMRRYVFSEVFAGLAFAGMAAATGEEWALRRAQGLHRSFVRYLRTPGLIPPKIDPRTRPMKSLSPLMCLLYLSDGMREVDPGGSYEGVIDACVEEILRDFVKPDDDCVLETVGPRGERLEGPDGRAMNPGHVIECAWFMLEVARRRQDPALAEKAIPLVDIALRRGWDDQYGGLFYWIDVEGRPAPQLEHDMKLWWPHNEALIALLLAYEATGESRYADWFEKMHEWTWAHFPDRECGEWFGYLHRDGGLSTPLKGGLWKGMFHVPRCLLLCWQALQRLSTRAGPVPGP